MGLVNMSKGCGVKEEMLLSDVIKNSPESVSILLDHGIVGIGQHIASNNTIKDAANLDVVGLYSLMYDLNKNRYTITSTHLAHQDIQTQKEVKS